MKIYVYTNLHRDIHNNLWKICGTPRQLFCLLLHMKKERKLDELLHREQNQSDTAKYVILTVGQTGNENYSDRNNFSENLKVLGEWFLV